MYGFMQAHPCELAMEAPPYLTSVTLERKPSCVVLIPHCTAEVRSWPTEQSRRLVFYYAWKAITKCHRQVAETTENYFLTVLESEAQDQGDGSVGFL